MLMLKITEVHCRNIVFKIDAHQKLFISMADAKTWLDIYYSGWASCECQLVPDILGRL